MKYESQRVAWWFFATCMLLFSLQIVYGFIMGFAHAGYDGLHDWIIPSTPARATHTNLLVMWLLCGFMGAAYYIVPEEASASSTGRSSPSCSWARSSTWA
jgi:nitric oxide reductase subunit B